MIKAGYVYGNELKMTSDDDARKLDVINIAFAHCRDSVFFFENTGCLEEIPRLKRANPAIKILISVGGWGSGGFSTMSCEASSRKKFAQSCLEAVRRHSLDGIDIDWEYPCLDWAGIDASPDDRENYTLMLKELRDTLSSYDERLMLTAAVGCDEYFINNSEMDKVANILDYVSLMTYDMRGCSDTVTGHHTNLISPAESSKRGRRSVEYSVGLYNSAGVPLNKIVIGIALYSRMWKNVRNESGKNGLNCAADPGNYGPSFGEIKKKYLKSAEYTRYWDDVCHAPYIYGNDCFISYDDEQSVADKCKYCSEHGLAGVMYWEHSCDDERTLLSTIYRFLK